MSREIITNPITPAQMHEELAFFIQFFMQLGREQCEVIFGFAWGNEYYPGREWSVITIPLVGLAEELRRVEAAELGRLGDDDLFVSVPPLPLEFHFCHESDLHITFSEPGEITEHFYQRWKSRGFAPAEWTRTAAGKPGERLRVN